MVWYNLTIGNWKVKYTPLNPIKKEYPYCDEDGNELKKVSGTLEKGYFINEKTEEKHEKAFRLINDKPFDKLKKTKEVETFKEVDVEESEDIIVEKEYLVESDELYNELNDSNKSIVFAYTSGNGFKVYKAYLTPSKLYKGFCIMSLGTTQKSEIIKDILDNKIKSDKLSEVELTIQKVNNAKAEELLQI